MKSRGRVDWHWPVCVAVLPALALALPSGVQYQGRLLDSGGSPVSGSVTVSVAVYTNATAGASIYTESVGPVTVQDGLYAFMFGNAAGFDTALDRPECWLQVQVNGTPLLPRQRLLSVPYAIQAGRVETVGTNTSFETGAVPGAAIAAQAVGESQLAAYAVRDNHVAANAAIGGAKINAATTIERGTVQLAVDGESAAGKAVQANDSRLAGGGSGWTDKGTSVELTTPGDRVQIGGTLSAGKVYVQTAGNYGLYISAGLNYGLYAQAANRYGVYGSAGDLGVIGAAVNNYGVYGSAANNGTVGNAAETYGVYGAANLFGVYGWGRVNNGIVGSSGNFGVYGRASNNYGVYGNAGDQYGVYGNARSYGVYGNAADWFGVYGAAIWNGVYGYASSEFGVYGNSRFNGVYGWADYDHAVRGQAGRNYGVYGYAPQNYGVYGTSTWYGVYGAADVDGVHGAAAVNGVSGVAFEQNGVAGFAPDYAVGARASGNYALHANALGNYGVYGYAVKLYGGYFTAANTGLYAVARTPGGVAVQTSGLIQQNGTNIALEGHAHSNAPPSGSAGGDLAGSYPNPSIATGVVSDAHVSASAAIAGAKIAMATTAARGTVELATDGESASNLAVQANDSRLLNARAPTGAAGGDLTGTYPSPQIATGTIVDADISAAASIDGDKIDLATSAKRGTVWMAADGQYGANLVVQGLDARIQGWTDDGSVVRLQNPGDQIFVGVSTGGIGKLYVNASYNANGIVAESAWHAVRAHATADYGVYGRANSYGVYGTSVYDRAVAGVATRNYGIYGIAGANYGVYGNAGFGYGVYGVAGLNNGVYGQAVNYGLYGTAATNRGVYGYAGANFGVYGNAAGIYGVYGNAAQGYGVYGFSAEDNGVCGNALGDFGLYAYAGANYGVYANAANFGAYVAARNSYGVYAEAKYYGVYAQANYNAVLGTSVYDRAVSALAARDYALVAVAGWHNAVYANAAIDYGVYASAGNRYGVYGRADRFGVYGNALDSNAIYAYAATNYGVNAYVGDSYAVYGRAGDSYGVYGYASTNIGVYGAAGGNYGGYFYAGSGNAIYCFGNMILPGGYNVRYSDGTYKAFTIDHPLDPACKILRHFSAEGPEALVIYSGTAELDARGEAQVRLPGYFDALSRNPRAQLTAVGAAMPGLHRGDFAGNVFAIGGGAPGGRVDWQVTAERDDPKAQLERATRPVEQAKGTPGAPAKGQYVSPECYR